MSPAIGVVREGFRILRFVLTELIIEQSIVAAWSESMLFEPRLTPSNGGLINRVIGYAISYILKARITFYQCLFNRSTFNSWHRVADGLNTKSICMFQGTPLDVVSDASIHGGCPFAAYERLDLVLRYHLAWPV